VSCGRYQGPIAAATKCGFVGKPASLALLSSTVVSTCKYNGVAQVVGTHLNEPDFYWRQYSTTGVYPTLISVTV